MPAPKKYDQPTVYRPARIPVDLDQFIQAKADKEALLSGKKPNWSAALVKLLYSVKE